MNNGNNKDMPFVFAVIILSFMAVRWVIETAFRTLLTFRRTIVWMIAATVAIRMGLPALIALTVFAIITAIVAWVKLGSVIRSVGNQFADKNEKVSETFNKIADVVEKVYPILRSAVRFFSFVPDFQRVGKIVQRNIALAQGNAFMRSIGALPTGFGIQARKKYGIYKVKEHNGEIVKDNNKTMGNQVIYLTDERKFPEMPLFDNNTFDDIIEAAESKIGAIMTDVSQNSHFMGTPAVKIEFISNIDNAIVEGNEFLKAEGIIDVNDNNFYDVEVMSDESGMTINLHEKISPNVSDTISKFKKAAENNNIKYMDIEQNNVSLYVKYYFNVDQEAERANDLLRNVGVIQKDDKHLYSARMFDNNVGNPTIVIDEQIGYETIESVYNKLVGIRSNYGSKYVDLKNKDQMDGDHWMVFEYVRKIDADVERAHDLLREAGVIDKNNAEIYNIKMTINEDEARFEIRDNIYGKNTKDIVRAAEGYKERYNARRVRTQTFGDGKADVLFIIKDFLASTKEVKRIPDVDLQDMRVVCAVDAYGNDISVNFKDTSAAGTMGVPGSGKSGSPNTFLGALAASPAVDFNIIDCKGGGDWDSLYPASNKVIRGAATAEELQTILDYLNEVYQEMRERISTMKGRTATNGKGGQDNYWNVSPEIREREGLKFKVILIDEFQKLFDDSKETSNLSIALKKIILALISESRSSGIMIAWITQRPTADEVPSAITKKTVQKFAFKSADEYVVKSFFGKEPGFNEPSPIDIPKGQPGRAVLYNDETSEFEECRFYFIQTADLPQYVEEAMVRNGKERNSTFDEYLKTGIWKKEYSGVKSAEEGDEKDDKEETRESSTRSSSTRGGRERTSSERFERSSARSSSREDKDSFRTEYTRRAPSVKKLSGEELKKKIIMIKSMIAKSEDHETTPNEREIARKKAESLMRRHGLTSDDLL